MPALMVQARTNEVFLMKRGTKPTGRTSFAAMNCSVAQALAQIGDAGTLMILRDAFNGIGA